MLTKKAFFALKVVLALLILLALIWTVHPSKIWQAFRSANFFMILLALLLLPLNFALQFYKWQFIVSWVRRDVRFSEAARTLLISLAIGLSTPGRVGEYARGFFVKGTDWATGLGLVAIDKLYSLFIMTALGGLALLSLLPKLPRLSFLPPVVPFILAAFFIFLLILLIFPHTFRGVIVRLGRHFPETHPFHRFIHGVELLNNRRGQAVFFLSLFIYVIFSIQFFILVNAFTPIPIETAARVVPSVFFIKAMLPVSIGDLGIREGASVFLFGKFGVAAAAAFNGPILLFVMNLLFPGLAGLYFLLKEKGARNKS